MNKEQAKQQNQAIKNMAEYQKMVKRQKAELADLKIKAEYWKAQFEIRYYTLEAEKLQEPYDQYLAAAKAASDEALKKLEDLANKTPELEIEAPMDQNVDGRV